MSEISTLFSGITVSGALFALGVIGLFGWGVLVGLIGAFADAPPFREGAHAPGARGSYDPRCGLHPDRAA
jgi:hypothetical protein